jgi:hypothetical protein
VQQVSTFFSAGGLVVEPLRANLDEDKVEDILMVKLNLEKLEVEEKKAVKIFLKKRHQIKYMPYVHIFFLFY